MATGTPKRAWTPTTPGTDRSDASDVIGAGISSSSPPTQVDLETQEAARVKRRRLLRQTSSEAEWLAMLKQAEGDAKKAEQDRDADVALASLLDACCLATPEQNSRPTVADTTLTLATTSAASTSLPDVGSTK